MLFYPFDRNQQAYFFPLDGTDQPATEFNFNANPNLDQEEYMTSVLLAQNAMEEGELDKVVLARNKLVQGLFDPLEIFHSAVDQYGDSFCYLVDLGEESWVGASPEFAASLRE